MNRTKLKKVNEEISHPVSDVFHEMISMKRDMDLIRKILLKIEENDTENSIHKLEIDGFTDDQIAYNVYLLKDAGLIEAQILFGGRSVKPHDYSILRLNWKGHEFLDACRDDARWREAKGIFQHIGGVTFDIAKEILIQIALRAAAATIAEGV